MAHLEGEARWATQGKVTKRGHWQHRYLLRFLWVVVVGSLYLVLPVHGVVDHAVFSSASLSVLPLLSRGTTISFVGSLGSTLMGCIIGLQTIDVCFDLAIVNNSHVSDGTVTLEARRVAYFYYHRVLNSPHVNGLLQAMVLCSCLGPALGMIRGSPEVQRRFVLLGVFSGTGSGTYLAVVVSRYLAIRDSPAGYQPELFDDWDRVFAARLVLYASTLLSLQPLYELQALAEVRHEDSQVRNGR